MTFDALVTVKRTTLEYPWLAMVAEIGGYVGLLLGVAVVDCVSLIESALIKL